MVDCKIWLDDFLNKNGIASSTYIQELKGGSRSKAYRINKQILRIPTKEKFLSEQEREADISLLLQENLPKKYLTQVTHILFNGNYSLHPEIEGDLLQALWNENKLSPLNIKKIAKQIAELLFHIHSIDIKSAQEKLAKYSKICRNENITLKPDFDYGIAKKHIWDYSEGKINLDDFKTSIDTDRLALCHNDLHAENIIIKDGKLSGFIDFGEGGINPRITDFFHFYRLSRDFALEVMKAYNDLSPFKINIKEADYQFLSNTGYTIEQRLRCGKDMPLFFCEVKKALLLFAESLNRYPRVNPGFLERHLKGAFL